MSNKPIEINEDCQFIQDLKNNNKLAMWNLIVIKGQLSLFSKGIKPTRYWRLKDVKNYFGLSGGTSSILEQLESIKSNIDNIVNDINLTNERD